MPAVRWAVSSWPHLTGRRHGCFLLLVSQCCCFDLCVLGPMDFIHVMGPADLATWLAANI